MQDVALEASWYSSSPHGEHSVAAGSAAYLPGGQLIQLTDFTCLTVFTLAADCSFTKHVSVDFVRLGSTIRLICDWW